MYISLMRARWNHMPWRVLILALGLLPLVGVAWAKEGVAIPSSLRQDIPIRVATNLTQETIDTAIAMQRGGWRYLMPMPKSDQASWRNHDGRTTWWIGYWQNGITGAMSTITPYWDAEKKAYVGNDKGGQSWRTGGAPAYPTEYAWLLSSGGGPK